MSCTGLKNGLKIFQIVSLVLVFRTKVFAVRTPSRRWTLNRYQVFSQSMLTDKSVSRRKYRQTVSELGWMSSRELQDLGINRAGIQSVLRQSVGR